MRKQLFYLLSIIGIFVFLAACSSSSSGNTNTDVSDASIDRLSLSVYDVGSSGYAEVSAAANTLTNDYGMQLTLLPSGNGVGRMSIIRDGTAPIGRLGDEYQFAYRADEEFSSKDWGPQDVRVVWGIMTHINGAVLEKSDIVTPEDLRGKRVPYLTGNASINIKTNSLLAAGGLTWDDVQKVELSSYAAQADALNQGQIDVAMMLPGAASLIEVDEMEGIRWIELPDPSNTEAWEAMQEETPWIVPDEWGYGAGLSKDDPQLFMSYPYPIVARADVDPVLIKEFVTRLVDSYDGYKDATATSFTWSKEYVSTMPIGVPFHEGAIEYFKDNDMWDEEKQAINDELVEMGEKYQEAWERILELADEEGISDNEFAEFWLENREQFLEE